VLLAVIVAAVASEQENNHKSVPAVAAAETGRDKRHLLANLLFGGYNRGYGIHI